MIALHTEKSENYTKREEKKQRDTKKEEEKINSECLSCGWVVVI